MHKKLDQTINIWSNFNLEIDKKTEHIKDMILPLLLQKSRFKYQRNSLVHFYRKTYRESTKKKSFMKIMKDLAEESIRRKCLPFHYFRYGLYANDMKKEQYLPDTIFFHKILPKMNKNNIILDDKILFDCIARSNWVPLPNLIFTYKKWFLHSPLWELTDADSFNALLNSLEYEKVVLKHSNYAHWGEWVHIFLKDKQNLSYYNETLGNLTLGLLQESQNDRIIQEFCRNQEDIEKIYKNSLNTFRILTYTHDEKVDIIWSILKFWIWDNKTDNAWNWWIYCNVDGTWQLWEFAYNQNLETFDRHPNSWTRFSDIKIHDFEKIIETVKYSSKVFSDTKIIWWDIALSQKWPVIIEWNSSPWLAIIQRPMKGILKNEIINILGGNNQALKRT